MPGVEQAMAAAPRGALAGSAESTKPKPIGRGPGAGAGAALQFGGVQTAMAGDAMELRRQFAAAGQGS